MKVVMRPNQSAVGTQYDFVQAVLNLKATKSERGEANITNLYDEFVVDHLRTAHIQRDGSDLNDAHNGPAFFPWHRQFLIHFEQALQKVSGNPLLGLPYWDWSVDQSEAPSPQPSWPFTPSFLGGDGSREPRVLDKVLDGAFAYDARKDDDPKKWVLNVRVTAEERTPWLSRRFGAGNNLSLPTPADVEAALRATPFDVDPYDSRSTSGFRNRAEGFIPFGMHNLVHVYVSGSMVPMTSPNDPVFFLHHCFVDKLWVDWQRRHQNDEGYQPYLPTHGARQGHNLGDYMPPWNTKPENVLYHHQLGYRYDTENYLLPGEELYQGQWIWSADKKYYILYGDQERVLWLEPTSGGKTIWQSATTNQPPGRCIMREDGNLVIYHIDVPYPHGKGNPYEPNPIWESQTSNNPGSYLWVSDEGYLELYRPRASNPFWRNGKLLP